MSITTSTGLIATVGDDRAPTAGDTAHGTCAEPECIVGRWPSVVARVSGAPLGESGSLSSAMATAGAPYGALERALVVTQSGPLAVSERYRLGLGAGRSVSALQIDESPR